ncbi:alpha/beta fold hydrolase [Lactobacillus sp. ESL0681]|uniref:alpha/beta hydrolase n=1 Tax=Lactobacillus sp. ESL0681 TaxID=2983211 RepID=UPI0023F9F1CF|nr:alpha/beta fold hydrolase [Lactobacillus sp. ESL0681]WEV40254.1 alpha/beta hydrolase-fold protein [Lactobacillus sp. ESL0681]
MKSRKYWLSALAVLPLGLLLTGCGQKKAAADSAVKPNQSQVVTTTMYSKKLHMDWDYDVYLPAGYNANSNKRYPVLYMMHGVDGNHRNLLERFNSQQILDGLIHRKNEKMIVVFIDGFNSFYINQKNGGMQMESAIVDDLIPTINKLYKTKTDPNSTAIGGISMGGYGAARLALKYPTIFNKAVLISPAVWRHLPKDNPIRMRMHAFMDGDVSWSDKFYNSVFPTRYINSDSRKVKLFVESTSADTTVPIKDVSIFVKELETNDVNVKFVKDSGDNHNWTYWTKVAPNAYGWALDQLN